MNPEANASPVKLLDETLTLDDTLTENHEDFPGGPMVKNPPCHAGHTGSIPGLDRSNMPWGN